MARTAWLVLLGLGFICAPTATGQEPPAQPKLKVEFRWGELQPIRGVTDQEPLTEDNGFQPNGRDAKVKVYLHKSPVLTGDCVAKAELIRHDSSNPRVPPYYTVWLRLTEKAKDKLADESKGREGLLGVLIVVVDGKSWWVTNYHKQLAADRKFTPVLGDFKTEADGQRLVDLFK